MKNRVTLIAEQSAGLVNCLLLSDDFKQIKLKVKPQVNFVWKVKRVKFRKTIAAMFLLRFSPKFHRVKH